MDALLVMLKNVIVFVALALPGYILAKTKLLKQEQTGALSKLLTYVGMPFLIFTSMINNIVINRALLSLIVVVAIVGVAYTLVLFIVSQPLTAMEKEKNEMSDQLERMRKQHQDFMKEMKDSRTKESEMT